jgi:hypothetical protein
MNLLFLLDWSIFLPVTLIRLMVIYFYGSKYSINGLKFLDTMMHADNKYFNQNLESELEPSTDTLKDDVRQIIKYDSHIYEMTEIKKRDVTENKIYNTTETTNIINNSNNDKNHNKEMSENYALDTEIAKNDDDDDDDKESNSSNNESSSDDDSNSISGEDSLEYNDSDELSDKKEELSKEKDLRFLIKNAKEKINIMMMK